MSRIRLVVASVVVASVVVACAPGPVAVVPPRVAWIADLDALEHHLGQRYANLEWNDAVRKLDLAALDRRTRIALTGARNDVEATEALARFVGAFRDAHLTWSSPLASTDYDVRFTSDGHKVAVRIAGPSPCGLAPGEEILAIDGKPALDQLARRLELGGFGNDALRRDIALRSFTSSPFAPRDHLDVTVHRAGADVRCTLAPRVAASKVDPSPPTATTSGEAACAAFGIVPTTPPTLPFLFQPDRHRELQPDAGAELASGILRLSGRSVGWLRIPLFSADAYPVACAQAWLAFRARLAGACDDACRDDFVDRVLPQTIVASIAARLDAFRQAGVAATVVDLTDNGGGDNWTDDVIRLMSRDALTCPATAFVREPAAVDRLDRELAGQRTCDRLPLDAAARRTLADVQAWTQQVRSDAAQPCDLTGRFHGAPATCTLLTRKRRAPCDRAASTVSAPETCTVFAPAKRRGLVDGPVYVLINRRTGSAAEAFAAILRDNHAATLIGEPTAGAGCGYVDGGSPITLAQSGMTVRLPNCARFRADGTNEVDGVAPDVVVPWTVDDLRQFESYAEKLLISADTLFPRR